MKYYIPYTLKQEEMTMAKRPIKKGPICSKCQKRMRQWAMGFVGKHFKCECGELKIIVNKEFCNVTN